MRFIVRRLVLFVLTLWAAVTLNFLLPRLMPGSPAEAALAKFAGPGAISPGEVTAIEIMLGVPKGSLWSQYLAYLGNILHGQFGISYTFFPAKVSTLILNAMPWTLALVGTMTIIAFSLGTILGILAAWHRGRAADTASTVGFTFLSAFPYFWTALLLLFVFGFVLGWFPIHGGYSSNTTPNLSLGFVLGATFHSVLPAITILISSLGGWLLGMRNNMINTLAEDYIVFAEANGIRARTIALRYAARNAILPNLTAFGMALGLVVSGSILVEVVFGYPGVGSLLYDAVVNQDYPLMQALFLIITVSVLVANFTVDLLYGILDPRSRA
ncbi:MAG: ABC transporter permease [Candidatus Dormibacteria bacterium]